MSKITEYYITHVLLKTNNIMEDIEPLKGSGDSTSKIIILPEYRTLIYFVCRRGYILLVNELTILSDSSISSNLLYFTFF